MTLFSFQIRPHRSSGDPCCFPLQEGGDCGHQWPLHRPGVHGETAGLTSWIRKTVWNMTFSTLLGVWQIILKSMKSLRNIMNLKCVKFVFYVVTNLLFLCLSHVSYFCSNLKMFPFHLISSLGLHVQVWLHPRPLQGWGQDWGWQTGHRWTQNHCVPRVSSASFIN